MEQTYEGTALAVQEPQALAMPMVTPAEAKAAMQAYYELCESVLTPDDYQEFTQKKKQGDQWVSEVKKFKKKSAVKKLAVFWNVEVEVLSADKDDLPDGNFAFRVIARARTKNGRIVDATGGCSSLEERFDVQPYDRETPERFEARRRKALARSYHDILSTAETRATNRAVMNCIGVGGGEVTADEVQRDKPARQAQPFVDRKVAVPHEDNPDATREKARVALMAFCRDAKHPVSDEARHAVTKALHGQESSNGLTLPQLRALRDEIIELIKAKIKDSQELEAWIQWRADLRNEGKV
jgi:hypothetical protein